MAVTMTMEHPQSPMLMAGQSALASHGVAVSLSVVAEMWRAMELTRVVLESDGVVRDGVSVADRELWDGRVRVRLTEQQTRVAEILLRHSGAVSIDQIMSAMYGGSHGKEYEVDPNIVKVLVSRIRRAVRLAGMRIRIDTQWGMGYRLVVLPSPIPDLRRGTDRVADAEEAGS